MKHNATCKVCGRSISIVVDDDYDTSDPLQLACMAVCNNCADSHNKHNTPKAKEPREYRAPHAD